MGRRQAARAASRPRAGAGRGFAALLLAAAAVLPALSPRPALSADLGSRGLPLGLAGLSSSSLDSLRRLQGEGEFSSLEAAARVLDGAVDPRLYRVGPGDRFAVLFGGRARAYEEAIVGPEGLAVFAGGSPVAVDGLTLEEAKARLEESGRAVWKGGRVEVLLATVRAFKVHVQGEVVSPGTYTVGAATRAGELVDRAGGLRPEASKRDLTLVRRSGERDRADLLLFQRTGESSSNPYVRDGDVLLVPPRRETAAITGEVYYPGEYEIMRGDRISVLLGLSGGVNAAALTDSIIIVRFSGDGAQEERTVRAADDPGIEAGDRVRVRRRPGWHLDERVTIEGEVVFPGVYTVPVGGERLSAVLGRAGGFTRRASVATAAVLRPRASDAGLDQRYQRLQGTPTALMAEAEFEYYRMRGVTDKVPLAVDFRRLGEADGDPVLRDGDRVIVPPTRGTVRVLGEVRRPGHVPFRAGAGWKEYAEAAGGFTDRADRKRARIARGDLGAFVPVSDAGAIGEDFIVWIPESRRSSWWQMTREAVTVVSQLATIYLIYDTVRN
jgi:protein involved in polysaccharide export with SLBB domain